MNIAAASRLTQLVALRHGLCLSKRDLCRISVHGFIDESHTIDHVVLVIAVPKVVTVSDRDMQVSSVV